MPIRLNLLAEAQEIEELRRRDPVKRIVLAGAVLVLIMLVWSSGIFFQSVALKGTLARTESELSARTNGFRQVMENQKLASDDMVKLAALNRLATNRFLMGSLLDALQRVPMDNVQLVHLQIDQSYSVTEAAKPSGDPDAPPPKPATATERILIRMSGRDNSAGDSVNRFREALSGMPFFRTLLGSTNEFHVIDYGSPQTDADSGKSFLSFSLEARVPDRIR